MHSRRGLVVGTAGHIDHGKTSLVLALTGIDTDRLKEEKKRGISIDLGFAEMELPDGLTISFVDVPGHERFVRNMLAGAAGMEAVLLIVAATESVKPQTREHFEICQLLGLRHGLIVLTKCDVATTEQIHQTRRDVESLVAGSFLAGASVVEVSAVTKAGLPELKRQLASMASQDSRRDAAGVARMPLDRCFAVKGFGTVVTGTLLAGTISVGEMLELHPSKVKVRVRGLQAQHAIVQQACAGQRVAVNLAGIEKQAIKRGYVLLEAGALAGGRMIDVELRWLDEETRPSPRESFVVHIGTAEVGARITFLRNSANARERRFARLRLSEEVIALPGDRFVIRRPSPGQTVGGGMVMDGNPARRLNRAKTLARLEALNPQSFEIRELHSRLELLLNETPDGRSMAELIPMTGVSRKQLEAAFANRAAFMMSADDRVVTRKWLEHQRAAILAWLRDFHKADPNAAGAPLAAARMGLAVALTGLIFKDFKEVRIQGETIALTSHRAQFSEQEATALQKLEHAFRSGGFQPPAVAETLAVVGVDAKKARALLESLIKSNRLVRLPDDLVFHADVIAHIRTSLTPQKGRRFSVADFKSWTSISRKFAIPLLEYLDQQRVTKRDGDMRVVL